MAGKSGIRRLDAVVLQSVADGAAVVVRYQPKRGPEIVDRVPLGGSRDLAGVSGVGRLLRVLRAARVKAPTDPYALADDPDRTAELLQQCQGARVILHVARRYERVLTLWTEDGVSRIDHVLDVSEDSDGLSVRRVGGDTALRVSRQRLIRFEVKTREVPEVVSVEVPTRPSLHS